MLPIVGSIRPWKDPGQVSMNRLRIHISFESSDRARLNLDGDWEFELFDSPEAVGDTVVTRSPESLRSTAARRVAVPGNWTLQVEEDLPHYTNIQMPFAGPPPRLPERNPTGVYRRNFSIDGEWPQQQTVLHIGGADSVHVVYLNGEFVGYGTDARLPSEYDVSAVLREGANDLVVVVIRYSAHSYIEDQDAWWMAGLHRSVFLESRPAVHVADLVTDGDWDPANRLGSLAVRCTAAFTDTPLSGYSVRARLELNDDCVVSSDATAIPHEYARPYEFTGHTAVISFESLEVQPWSAENPTLYTCRIDLIDPQQNVVETASQRVGFRRVRVDGAQLLVNGERVWIFGVNRHDHNPDRGTAITVDDIRADLVAMRRHNINAIRTSHYPNDSAFYDLCDELGFYLIDESNIESHAYNWLICNDPTFRSAWLERGARMVQRDRNHPSVVIWSLGNESGYGANHDALAGWIRHADPSRPLHYEDAIRLRGWDDGGLLATDLVCPMYPTIDDIAAYGERVRRGEATRPLIMCEYSHAMGNSNGSLADYWEVIRSTPGLQGGFLWEWKDHGLRQRLADGTTRLAYGGQFGEEPHDGNFVADGLVSADLEPHPAMAEVAWVHRPVTVELVDDELRITNRRSFSDLADLNAQWELLVDGQLIAEDDLAVCGVAAGAQILLELPMGVPSGGEAFLTVRWFSAAPTWFAEAGHLVAWDQMRLSSAPDQPRQPADASDEMWKNPTELFGDGVVSEATLQLWRAATDNDGFKLMLADEADSALGSEALQRWIDTGVAHDDPEGLVRHQASIDSTADGVTARHVIEVPDGYVDLPRVGISFTVDPRFSEVRWYGRGPHENYPDRRSSAMLGIWRQPVDQLPYLVPQEYGLRTDTRWFELIDPATEDSIRVTSEAAPFHFSAIRHTAEQLFAASTATDLTNHERLVVSIDAAHRGLGTASCGPDVLQKYRIPAGRQELAYRIDARRGR